MTESSNFYTLFLFISSTDWPLDCNNCKNSFFEVAMGYLSAILLLLTMLVACSKQAPIINKSVVQEDKRNISELKASVLIDSIKSPEEINQVLHNINSFHVLNFSFRDFWKSLRYPSFEINKVSASNITSFGLLGDKSCTELDSEAYIQFLIYLRHNLSTNLDEAYLRLISSHLEKCSPKHRITFYRPLLKEVTEIYLTIASTQALTDSFAIFRHLLNQNDPQINQELGRLFSEHLIQKTSKLIEKNKDIDQALSLSSLLRNIHPLNQRLSFLPLQEFVGTHEHVLAIFDRLRFDDASVLFKKLEEKLPYNHETINLFVSSYLRKLDSFYNGNISDDESRSSYIDALTNAYVIFSFYNHEIDKNLDMIESLSSKGANAFSKMSELDILESRSESSLVAATMLAKKLTPEAFSKVSLPRGEDKITKTIKTYFEVKMASGEQDKLKHKEKFCESFTLKNITSIEVKLKSGCYHYTSNVKKLIVSTSLQHSYFSAIDLNVEEVVLKSLNNNLGILNLSNTFKHEVKNVGKTPEQNDAVVIPLLLSLHSDSRKGVFEKDSKYYFFYHLVYDDVDAGPAAVDEAFIPLDGKKGGDLSVLENAENVFNFISYGSEGQTAPAPFDGGKGYEFQFDESSYELWISDFINFNSYLMSGSFRNIDNIKLLSKIAKRDEDKSFLIYLDPNYTKLLSDSSLNHLDTALNIANKREGWGCQDRECNLKNASFLALKEISALVAMEHFPVLLKNMNPKFTIENGKQGPKLSNGLRGKNGKVISYSSL